MAKVGTIKVPKKVVRTRDPLFLDEKYTGTEPQWDAERALKMDDATFDHKLRKSLNYYNHFYNTKSTRKHLNDWLKRSNKLNKEMVDKYVLTADRYTPMTACSLVMAAKAGMPLKDKHVEFILTCVVEAIAKSVLATNDEIESTGTAAKIAKKVVAPVITIQDRLNERLSELLGELEGRLDDSFVKKETTPKAFEFFQVEKVPGALVNKIKDHFQNKADKFTLIQNSKEADYKEAHSQYKAADWKRIQAWIASLMADCDSYTQTKKVERKPRTPRSVSKDKIVSKLKYQIDDKVLKLVSIKPVDIIGASELWVYDTKTRKLGRYMADSHLGPLSVKGTTIIGFNTATSVTKTLRKPAEQLAAFVKTTKPQVKKFMSSVTTTETQLSGRINDRTLLLRVV